MFTSLTRTHKQNKAPDPSSITADSKLSQDLREEHRISIREENNPRFTCLSGFFLSTDAEPTSSPILFFYAFSSKRESSWSTSPILQSGSSSSEELSVCDRDLVWKVLKSEHGL